MYYASAANNLNDRYFTDVELLAEIEEVLYHQPSDCIVIIGGDFHADLRSDNTVSNLFRNFMSPNKLCLGVDYAP